MHQVINIKDDDIAYAESVLLPSGRQFDEERKAFIRDLNTIDLQAVPGSGKTTALLAKLIILERKLPFADGSGILVLSHTNAAIDEIKEKIQRHCPKLFSSPNFVGTIQGFVDEFLAIPFYISKFKKRPIRIDSEIYNERIRYCLQRLWLYKFGFKNETTDKVAFIKNSNETLFYDFRFRLSDSIELVRKLNEDILEVKKPRGNTKLQNYKDYTPQEKQDIYNWFLKFKKELLKLGVLHFDDAYFLGGVYLNKFPEIKTILQKRFCFVFVDEMQDMDTHQYNVLEKIFYDEGNSFSKFQRIGDKNQAIYNSFVKTNDIWVDRPVVLRLNGSQRLSEPIAEFVKKFALHTDVNFDIVGLCECVVKPHILIFENETIGNIVPCFAQIVRENGLANAGKVIKVVCWNTEWKDDERSRTDPSKLRLEDYHKSFKKERSKPKQDYDNLKSYLLYYEKKKTLEPIRKNILNAFLKILRLENINSIDRRYYTKKQLIDFIQDKDIQKYNELNLKLYNWSIGIVQERLEEVWNGIKEYVPTLLAIFERTVSASSDFINIDETDVRAENTETLATTNYYEEDGLQIEITSVHAVKGQTHTATLYLESFYSRGYGNYESERLRNQFSGAQTVAETLATVKNSHDLIKQSAKMAYVGFSRPTDLLCIAIHKDRFDQYLSKIDSPVWEIRTVSK